MKIVLTGFMGSGKTTVGGILAERLSLPFIDTDSEILKLSGYASVPLIFEKEGEAAFRRYETEIAKKITALTEPAVISTGGGMITNPENFRLLKSEATVVYLETGFNTICERVEKEMAEKEITRPLFKDKGSAKKLYDSRQEIYEKHCDLKVSTDGRSQREVASEIITKLKLGARYRCAVIGQPVSKSLSPLMHNAGYRALNLNYSFEARAVSDASLPEAISWIRQEKIKGVSVTIPHKVAVMQYLDQISEVAKKIGAVNTIYWEDEKLTGTNTDWIGVLNPLTAKVTLKGKRAAVLGAGGAARSACYALMLEGAEATVMNRTKTKAETLAGDFGFKAVALNEVSSLDEFEIIINSVPYVNGEPALDPRLIQKNHLLFDLIYIPHETVLIRAAKDKGAQVIHGIEMLLHQGVEQFRIYTGHQAPVKVMEEALFTKINAA